MKPSAGASSIEHVPCLRYATKVSGTHDLRLYEICAQEVCYAELSAVSHQPFALADG